MDRSGTILSARSLLEHTDFAEMMDIGCCTEGCQRRVGDDQDEPRHSICGWVFDALMHACLTFDPRFRVACEPCLTENMVMVAGETCCRVTDMYFGAGSV